MIRLFLAAVLVLTVAHLSLVEARRSRNSGRRVAGSSNTGQAGSSRGLSRNTGNAQAVRSGRGGNSGQTGGNSNGVRAGDSGGSGGRRGNSVAVGNNNASNGGSRKVIYPKYLVRYIDVPRARYYGGYRGGFYG